MSKILSFQNYNYINTTQPILIKSPTHSANYSLSNNNFDNKYFFKLNINNNQTLFSNVENNKYSKLINSQHKIKYEDIKTFEIEVVLTDSLFKLKGTIDHNSTSYVENSNNLYIEFSQDYLGYVNCICYFHTSDLNLISISPPN